MDLRTQISLLAAVLALAIAAPVVLRPHRQKIHTWFGIFAVTTSIWYFTTFLSRMLHATYWTRLNIVLGIFLPIVAARFFGEFVGKNTPHLAWLRRASLFGSLLCIVVFTPLYDHIAVAAAIVILVTGLLGTSVWMLLSHSATLSSRFEKARIRYLALVGLLAAVFTLVDYLPYLGLEISPVGTLLTLAFLYVLSQSILRDRLLDIYELTGRLSVLTVQAFTLSTVLWLLLAVTNQRFFLHAVAAVLVVLLISDPLRAKVTDKISELFFRERYGLEQSLGSLRQSLARVLELKDLTRFVLRGLEESRRVTHAAVYLMDERGLGLDLAGSLGPDPAARIDLVPARPLIDRCLRAHIVSLEEVERELASISERGDSRGSETLFEIVQIMNAMHAAVCIPFLGGEQVYGLLTVKDERLTDAFSPEELQLLRGLGAQASTAIENSKLYRRLMDRDRLLALGEMATGIAHEIRNPLGAIKASAQYLVESSQIQDPNVTREFLDIIVSETDRLNRVVSSFLDFARPSAPETTEPTALNKTIEKTFRLLGPECDAHNVQYRLILEPSLPEVRIDEEHVRQVIMNLVQNAIQAMDHGGELIVETSMRDWPSIHGVREKWGEMRIRDTGPGIAGHIADRLFVPFVTTKKHGTGLGLAISQRLVTAVGGHIEAVAGNPQGTMFVVRLPLADAQSTSLTPSLSWRP